MKPYSLSALFASGILSIATAAGAAEHEIDIPPQAVDEFHSGAVMLSDQQIDEITAGGNQFANIRIDLRYVDANGVKQRFVYRFKGKVKHNASNKKQKNVRTIVNKNVAVFNNVKNATARQVNSANITTFQSSGAGNSGTNVVRSTGGNYTSVRQ